MKLGDGIYRHNVIVADIMDDCILGLDFMRKHRCEIDVDQGVLKCGSVEIFMDGASRGKVYCLKKIALSHRSEIIVQVSLPGNSSQEKRCVLVEGVGHNTSWKLARTLIKATNFSAVRMLNPSGKELVIKSGTMLGTCEEVAWLRGCQDLPTKTKSGYDVSSLLEDCQENEKRTP